MEPTELTQPQEESVRYTIKKSNKMVYQKKVLPKLRSKMHENIFYISFGLWKEVTLYLARSLLVHLILQGTVP